MQNGRASKFFRSLPLLICGQARLWRTVPCSNLDSYVEQQWVSFPRCLLSSKKYIIKYKYIKIYNFKLRTFLVCHINLSAFTCWKRFSYFLSFKNLNTFCLSWKIYCHKAGKCGFGQHCCTASIYLLICLLTKETVNNRKHYFMSFWVTEVKNDSNQYQVNYAKSLVMYPIGAEYSGTDIQNI